MTGGFLTFSATSAQAFSFTTNFTGKNAKNNIMLNSVTLGNGSTVSDFTLVDRAKVVYNDKYTGGNTGAASADLGDKATIGIKQEDLTAAGAVKALGNLNLNSIIDTEDVGKIGAPGSGVSTVDVWFSKAADNVFLWERGMNSMMDVQALDYKGNVIGKLLTLNSTNWGYAGFSIDTTEIDSAQKMGSMGISRADFGVKGPIFGIRVASKSTYNGPDWKVTGSKAVPEPATLTGLGIVGAFIASRRKKAKQA